LLLFLVSTGLGDPIDYENMIVSLRPGQSKSRNEIMKKLVNMQYSRNEMDFKRGTFRAKGDILEIYPSNEEEKAVRVEFWGDTVENINEINPLTGKTIGTRNHVMVFPNSHYVTTKDKMEKALITIEEEMSGLETICIKIDREKLASANEKTAELRIEGNDGHGAKILVKVHIDAAVPDCNFPAGTFVQTGNYVSMEAPHFVRSSGFDLLEGYGKTLGAVKAKDVITTFAPDAKNSPFVEYAFALDPAFVEKTGGPMAFDVYLNPSNPAYKDNKLQFVAEINGVKLLKDVVDAETFAVGDNQFPWGDDITNNIRIATVYADCKAGLNLLKISPVTPNIVIEKIVIHEANTKMPSSYLGAPETYRIK